jgi:hypothetical protein
MLFISNAKLKNVVRNINMTHVLLLKKDIESDVAEVHNAVIKG